MTRIEWQPMRTAPAMFPPERLGEAVLAHTPVIQPPGCTAGYVILRETTTQYLVHNAEVDEHGKFVGLYWGHYFDKDEPDGLNRAMRVFVEKTCRWHNFHNLRFVD